MSVMVDEALVAREALVFAKTSVLRHCFLLKLCLLVKRWFNEFNLTFLLAWGFWLGCWASLLPPRIILSLLSLLFNLDPIGHSLRSLDLFGIGMFVWLPASFWLDAFLFHSALSMIVMPSFL